MDISKYQGNGFITEINDREREKLVNSKILIAGKGNLSAEVIKNLNRFGIKNADNIDSNDLENSGESIKNYDIIIDCLKSVKDKFLLNTFSVKHNKPFVYSNITGAFAQATIIIPDETPCLECLFEEPEFELNVENCEETNVVKQMASVETNEAINLLLKRGTGLKNNLLTYCADDENFRTIKLSKKVQCKNCSKV